MSVGGSHRFAWFPRRRVKGEIISGFTIEGKRRFLHGGRIFQRKERSRRGMLLPEGGGLGNDDRRSKGREEEKAPA